GRGGWHPGRPCAPRRARLQGAGGSRHQVRRSFERRRDGGIPAGRRGLETPAQHRDLPWAADRLCPPRSHRRPGPRRYGRQTPPAIRPSDSPAPPATAPAASPTPVPTGAATAVVTPTRPPRDTPVPGAPTETPSPTSEPPTATAPPPPTPTLPPGATPAPNAP